MTAFQAAQTLQNEHEKVNDGQRHGTRASHPMQCTTVISPVVVHISTGFEKYFSNEMI